MARTSIIERITLAVIAELSAELKHQGAFALVGRDMPEITGPESLANLQLPALIVNGGLPQVVKAAGAQGIGRDTFLSEFRLVLLCLDHANVGMAARINNLADEIWRVVLANQTWGDAAAVATSLRFDEVPRIQRPIVIFGAELTITYKHTKGGI